MVVTRSEVLQPLQVLWHRLCLQEGLLVPSFSFPIGVG